ncbi:hypothetical protein [Halobacteriovorax sp. CON-3]|uniref:hypothetical protein n=1 Tax=Halobacteriovorax sp. CON-3 TaxID=3157710 RepID=UPI0037133C7A
MKLIRNQNRFRYLSLITLKNDKIYIGEIRQCDLRPDSDDDDGMKVLLHYSGYRCPFKKVHVTTDYTKSSSKSNFPKFIFQREITDISQFSINDVQKFIEQKSFLDETSDKSLTEDEEHEDENEKINIDQLETLLKDAKSIKESTHQLVECLNTIIEGPNEKDS